MKPPCNYYGGKQKMLKHILPLIPPHEIYVEAFAGGASVFFAKKPVKVEVLNDINGNVANFYRVMKSQFNALAKEIKKTIHDEYTHSEAKGIYFNPNGHGPVKRAWAFWVAANMSFGHEVGGSFQITCNRNDRWTPPVKTRNKKARFIEYEGRLENTMVMAKDAISLLMKYNLTDTFTYLDPPYFGANQGHYSGYTRRDFMKLLLACRDYKGMFLLSSYPSDLLTWFTERYGWRQKEIKQRLGVTHSGKMKIEVLTWNYPEPYRQGKLF